MEIFLFIVFVIFVFISMVMFGLNNMMLLVFGV